MRKKCRKKGPKHAIEAVVVIENGKSINRNHMREAVSKEPGGGSAIFMIEINAMLNMKKSLAVVSPGARQKTNAPNRRKIKMAAERDINTRITDMGR